MADASFIRFKYDPDSGHLILAGWNGDGTPTGQISEPSAAFMHREAEKLGVTYEAYCRFCSGAKGPDVDQVKAAVAS